MIDRLVDDRDLVVMVAADKMPGRYGNRIGPRASALPVGERASAGQ
jgi:hypothetical protein